MTCVNMSQPSRGWKGIPAAEKDCPTRGVGTGFCAIAGGYIRHTLSTCIRVSGARIVYVYLDLFDLATSRENGSPHLVFHSVRLADRHGRGYVEDEVKMCLTCPISARSASLT